MTGATIWQSFSASPGRCAVSGERHRFERAANAPFLEMPEPFRKLQAKMLRQPGGDREMVDILSLVLHHDEQAVLRAVEMALQAGVPTKTHVLNLLHRLLDGTPTEQPDVTPPAALSLSKEPEANVARYDGLRPQKGTRHAS